jgi:hypothetical protein
LFLRFEKDLIRPEESKVEEINGNEVLAIEAE